MTVAIKESAEGRICKFPDCHKLLSIYNHQEYCHVHIEDMPAKSALKNRLIKLPAELLVE
jgi:hypothetical protein